MFNSNEVKINFKVVGILKFNTRKIALPPNLSKKIASGFSHLIFVQTANELRHVISNNYVWHFDKCRLRQACAASFSQ